MSLQTTSGRFWDKVEKTAPKRRTRKNQPNCTWDVQVQDSDGVWLSIGSVRKEAGGNWRAAGSRGNHLGIWPTKRAAVNAILGGMR